MPFDPNATVPEFDAPPLQHHRLEETSLALVQEFLAGYFDGHSHTLAAKSYTFPLANLAFQANPGKQPLDGFSIHVIGSSQKTDRKFYIPSGLTSRLWFFNKQEWAVIIRSVVTAARADNDNSESLCVRVADLCYAVLTTPLATLHLNRKGFSHLRADPPQPLASAEYKMRRIVLRGTLQCVAGSGP